MGEVEDLRGVKGVEFELRRRTRISCTKRAKKGRGDPRVCEQALLTSEKVPKDEVREEGERREKEK